MRHLAISAAFAAGLLASWLFMTVSHGSAHAAVRVPNRAVVLSVGDRFRVEDAPLGCRVTRVREFGSRVFVDCRRGGLLTGSFGTLISEREAMIVHFRNARTAKVVFQAEHEGRSQACH